MGHERVLHPLGSGCFERKFENLEKDVDDLEDLEKDIDNLEDAKKERFVGSSFWEAERSERDK